MDEDFALLDRLREGDETAFEMLMRKYQRPVAQLAYRLVGNAADAEDLAQQAFVQVYRHHPGFQRQSSFKTWLYRIIINLCKNHVRRRRPSEELDAEQPLAAGGPTALSGAIEEQRLARIRAALAELPRRQREVVALRVYEDMPYEQIARVLGCSENSAKVNFHYAVRNLRQRLADAGGSRRAGWTELAL
jgi:RNA polymerase sigma-70 factor (ECF subfamily)